MGTKIITRTDYLQQQVEPPEAQFFKALRESKSKGLDGARMLQPPMPWGNYAQAKDEDLKAIFAYPQSTTPVKNIVPHSSSPSS